MVSVTFATAALLAQTPAICYPSAMKPHGFQMTRFSITRLLAAASLLALATPALAADEDAPRGPAVTVLKAAKSCFANIVEVSGSVMPPEEKAGRPDRVGL